MYSQALRKPSFRLVHKLEDVGSGRQGIAAGSQVQRNERCWLRGLSRLAFLWRSSQPRHIGIVLRSHFHPRDIFQAQDGAVRLGADNNLIELLRCRQASGSANVIGELLPLRNRFDRRPVRRD